jgi:nucleoid DNA-binding protein
MDELVELVVKKTGIPEETARKAVNTVLDYLKDKLPEPVAGMIDNFLEGDTAGDLLEGLGDLFGG